MHQLDLVTTFVVGSVKYQLLTFYLSICHGTFIPLYAIKYILGILGLVGDDREKNNN